MSAGTGELRALADEVAKLSEVVRQLAGWHVVAFDRSFEAGFAAGQDAARPPGVAARSRARSRGGAARGHLRVADGLVQGRGAR